MFKLKRPCANCPFKKGQGELFRLGQERVRSIVLGPAFQCHKTVDYSDEEEQGPLAGDKPQQCTGLMAVLYKSGMENQIMQMAMRLGELDPDTLDPDNEAYDSVTDAEQAHEACNHLQSPLRR